MQEIKGSAINSMIIGNNYFCSLCFKTVVDNAIHVEDKVIVMKRNGTYDEVFMTDILSNILGPEIEDQLTIFNAVCNQCSAAAISSYKFLITCKENSQKLYNTIDGLTKGTEICLTNTKDSKAAFVSVNTENFEYNGYTTTKTSNKRSRIYQKFLNLHYNVHYNDEKEKQKSAIELVPVKTEDLNCNENPDSETYIDNILKVKLVKLKQSFLTKKKLVICPGCDKFFCSRYSMNNHYKQKHVSQNTQCTKFVTFSGSELELLRKHINYSHVLNFIPGSGGLFEILSLDKNKVNSKKVPLILKKSVMNNNHKILMTTK